MMTLYFVVCAIFFVLFFFALENDIPKEKQISLLGRITICSFVALFWWVFLIIVAAMLLSLPKQQ